MLLASLYAPDGGWLKRLAGALLEGFTQGTLGESETFAPTTGYISFFTLALYVIGLVLLPAAPEADSIAASEKAATQNLIAQYQQLPLEERVLVHEEIVQMERGGRIKGEILSSD
jgi:hypothetical protein